VKNVVKEIKGIESVEADHNTGIVKIKCDTDVNMKEVKEAIEDLDFKVE
jgi:copper chaperone CopZ